VRGGGAVYCLLKCFLEAMREEEASWKRKMGKMKRKKSL
jgi:hypothetical protein